MVMVAATAATSARAASLTTVPAVNCARRPPSARLRSARCQRPLPSHAARAGRSRFCCVHASAAALAWSRLTPHVTLRHWQYSTAAATGGFFGLMFGLGACFCCGPLLVWWWRQRNEVADEQEAVLKPRRMAWS